MLLCVCVISGTEPRGILPLSYTPSPIFLFYDYDFVVLGIAPRGILPSSYTPNPILFLIWKQGLIRLMKVSLLAEAVLEPAILSQPPKYWDYKRVPPRLAETYHFKEKN